MNADFSSLEQKVNQFVALCQRLRADNQQLRQQLALAQNENRQLAEKIGIAQTRLESLLNRIPEEEV
jgi:cell division protein ZapB